MVFTPQRSSAGVVSVERFNDISFNMIELCSIGGLSGRSSRPVMKIPVKDWGRELWGTDWWAESKSYPFRSRR
jgi:hypothetical protein